MARAAASKVIRRRRPRHHAQREKSQGNRARPQRHAEGNRPQRQKAKGSRAREKSQENPRARPHREPQVRFPQRKPQVRFSQFAQRNPRSRLRQKSQREEPQLPLSSGRTVRGREGPQAPRGWHSRPICQKRHLSRVGSLVLRFARAGHHTTSPPRDMNRQAGAGS